MKVAIGIDVGGTNTKFGLVDREGNIYGEGQIKTNGKIPFDDFLKDLHHSIEEAQAAAGRDFEIIGVGIGAPNGNIHRGTIENPPNLTWEGITPFVDKFKAYYNVPMVLTNDANAAAIGEMVFGSAKGMKDFIMFTLGTGLGSGIVANGELIYGNDGFAGELGHTLVNVFGRECGCGRKGCLETYVSATGIKRTVYKLLADHMDDSILRNVSFDDLTGRMITEAAIKQDPIAIKAFDYTGRVLGMKLADTVVHFSPEAIFLFGGLVNAGGYLFGPAKYHMEDNMMPLFKNKVKLLPSGLLNKNAAVLGASSLIWEKV